MILKKIRNWIERNTEAITFAEAGILDVKETKEIIKHPKVIMVTEGDCFSEKIQEYVLEFVKRMDYDIIALNVGVPVQKLNSPVCDALCEQFNLKCEESIKAFRKKCEEENISFINLTKFGDIDSCILEVNNEFDHIDFIITEPENEMGAVPVFCIAH